MKTLQSTTRSDTKDGEAGHSMTEHIETALGASFYIEASLCPKYVFKEDCLLFTICLDGKRQTLGPYAVVTTSVANR
jgi:hypothetical protein